MREGGVALRPPGAAVKIMVVPYQQPVDLYAAIGADGRDRANRDIDGHTVNRR
jgi:hypothetical protein